ncbi:hypothetical protein [Nostoc sp.]
MHSLPPQASLLFVQSDRGDRIQKIVRAALAIPTKLAKWIIKSI